MAGTANKFFFEDRATVVSDLAVTVVFEELAEKIQMSGTKPAILKAAEAIFKKNNGIWQPAAVYHWFQFKPCDTNGIGTIIPQDSAPFYKDIAFGTQDLRGTDSPSYTEGVFGNAEDTHRFIVNLVEKLKRQLQLYSSVNALEPISGIWLMGEGASIPMVAEDLERHFQMSCESLNPLSLFENKVAKRHQLPMNWQHFGIAAGMAMSGLKWQGEKHVASN